MKHRVILSNAVAAYEEHEKSFSLKILLNVMNFSHVNSCELSFCYFCDTQRW